MNTHVVEVLISKQEDGLWRAEAPALPGCFVDAETIREAISDIQECIAMALDLHLEEGWELPSEAKEQTELPLRVSIPIAIHEFRFKRAPARMKATKTSA